MFILNCRDKAKFFNHFSNQCRLITNTSIFPTFNFLADKRIDKISIRSDEIVSLVRNLNPNKASGSDGISGQMLLMCDKSVVLPLKIILRGIPTVRSHHTKSAFGQIFHRNQMPYRGSNFELMRLFHPS